MRAEVRTVRLETFPSLDQARPLSDPVKIILSVLDSNGKPLEHGRLNIRLIAPPPGWLLSTDLPLVEGTDLLEMNLPVSQGRVSWEYVFPIRGIYRLEVSALGEEAKEVKSVFEIGIKENRMKLFYLGIFVAALFLFGFMAGRLFTPYHRTPHA